MIRGSLVPGRVLCQLLHLTKYITFVIYIGLIHYIYIFIHYIIISLRLYITNFRSFRSANEQSFATMCDHLLKTFSELLLDSWCTKAMMLSVQFYAAACIIGYLHFSLHYEVANIWRLRSLFYNVIECFQIKDTFVCTIN